MLIQKSKHAPPPGSGPPGVKESSSDMKTKRGFQSPSGRVSMTKRKTLLSPPKKRVFPLHSGDAKPKPPPPNYDPPDHMIQTLTQLREKSSHLPVQDEEVAKRVSITGVADQIINNEKDDTQSKNATTSNIHLSTSAKEKIYSKELPMAEISAKKRFTLSLKRRPPPAATTMIAQLQPASSMLKVDEVQNGIIESSSKRTDEADVSCDASPIVGNSEELEDSASNESARDNEFGDDEIKEAFHILDLDKNGYIGVAELRHALAYMGESVTDVELDTMITMLDANGDGQVSYDEFHSMVRSPDPSTENFHRVSIKKCDRNGNGKLRTLKRESLSRLVGKYGIGKVHVQSAWKSIEEQMLSSERGIISGMIDVTMFCELFGLDPTGEVHSAFKLFDPESSGKVEARIILLGLCNFVKRAEMSVESRCALIFDMFDEDKSGTLSLTELENILAANHMEPVERIKRKAQIIFKSIDADGSGDICMKELISVSHKFPNILLPQHHPE